MTVQNGYGNHDNKMEIRDISLSFEKHRRTTLEKSLLLLVFLCACAIIGLVVAVVIISQKDDGKTTNDDTMCTSAGCASSAARLIDNINENIDPCEDFFEFACGKWMKKNVIPEDRSSYDMFGVLRDDVEVIEKIVLEEPITSSEASAVTKAKHLFSSCMNESLIESQNISVINNLLSEIGEWPILQSGWSGTGFNLTSLLVKLLRYSNKPLMDLYVYTDLKNSTSRILYIDQPGFGMPGRKYYLQGKDHAMVVAYKTLAQEIAIELGASAAQAETDVKDMVDLEFDIANISMADEDRRDSNALYNPMAIHEMHRNFTPPNFLEFDWFTFISDVMQTKEVNIPITTDEVVIVRAIPYFEKLFDVLSNYDNRTITNYVIWRIMKNRASNLPERFRDMVTKYNKVLGNLWHTALSDVFCFFFKKNKTETEKAIYGTSTARARWRTCASYTNNNMGLAVGRLFIKEAFDEAAKADTLDMIKNLRAAFGELLDGNDWMDDATRGLAREKAKYIQEKIGYEDYILNNTELNRLYENYTVGENAYFENVLHMLHRSVVDSFRKLREVVDKNEWFTAPATVNAYYNSVLNRIMFPAGILQPPFYSKSQPKSMNYGGIGVVIGHEITHGFDDRGRQYDKDGNLKQWWTTGVIDNFKKQAQCIINQYGNFSVPEADGMKLNGINTQGENIADNGGLKQSYRAYKNWIKTRGSEEARLPGVKYTHEQIFFINFAQIWCSNMRRENAINRILTGVHSPGRFRVTGTLQNFAEFAKAFQCQIGSKMNPGPRCSVW